MFFKLTELSQHLVDPNITNLRMDFTLLTEHEVTRLTWKDANLFQQNRPQMGVVGVIDEKRHCEAPRAFVRVKCI